MATAYIKVSGSLLIWLENIFLSFHKIAYVSIYIYFYLSDIHRLSSIYSLSVSRIAVFFCFNKSMCMSDVHMVFSLLSLTNPYIFVSQCLYVTFWVIKEYMNICNDGPVR